MALGQREAGKEVLADVLAHYEGAEDHYDTYVGRGMVKWLLDDDSGALSDWRHAYTLAYRRAAKRSEDPGAWSAVARAPLVSLAWLLGDDDNVIKYVDAVHSRRYRLERALRLMAEARQRHDPDGLDAAIELIEEQARAEKVGVGWSRGVSLYDWRNFALDLQADVRPS